MLKKENIKAFAVISLAIVFIVMAFSSGAFDCQADPFTEVREKLSGITEEEKEILKNLFVLLQEIELMEAEEKRLAQEINDLKQEITALEKLISAEQNIYDKKRGSLESVLKSYQRMGPGSFLEIVLDSDSLSAFLQRVNILRELTRNTGELLDQLGISGEKLSKEKDRLAEKLQVSQERQKQSQAALAKKLMLKEEKEAYLVSLKGERDYYQQHMESIEKTWDELKPMFSNAANEFNRIMEEVTLPADALRISFSFIEIKGAIDDTVINRVVSEQSRLPLMLFSFRTGKVEISLPEKDLLLSGTFILTDGTTLRFQADQGSFLGMPLEQGSIEELFREGDLVLNLKPLLAGNVIHDVRIKDGYLELVNKLGLF